MQIIFLKKLIFILKTQIMPRLNIFIEMLVCSFSHVFFTHIAGQSDKTTRKAELLKTLPESPGPQNYYLKNQVQHNWR